MVESERPNPPTVTRTQNVAQQNFVRNKLQRFRRTLLNNVELRISDMIDEIMQEIRQNDIQRSQFGEFANLIDNNLRNTWGDNRAAVTTSGTESRYDEVAVEDNLQREVSHKIDSGETASNQSKLKPLRLPDKVFVIRESYLTALLGVAHILTIYHIFCMILIWCLLNTITYDYFVEGRVSFGLGTLKSGMNKIHITFIIWIFEHFFVAGLYYAFKIWTDVWLRLAKPALLRRLWSISCIIIHLITQFLFIYIATALGLRFKLPFIPSAVLHLETMRLVMKMHAFIRTNAGRLLWTEKYLKPKVGNQLRYFIAPFRHYVYFLFAPTLLYRDYYPRTAQIRWTFALSRLSEVVAITFLYAYMYERIIFVHFANYGLEELNAAALLAKLFGMMMPAIVIVLSGFYMIMHSWLNFTAELLRFGDRMFYNDWWTANSYAMWFRNWNVVVHDWMYEYIYKDSYLYLFKGSKPAAFVLVFTVSALAHEHIVGFSLRLFFPLMFTFFGLLGLLFVYLTRTAPKHIGNVFLWFTLITGCGLLISFYSMEYYAKFNCNAEYGYWRDYVIPAAWRCYYMMK